MNFYEVLPNITSNSYTSEVLDLSDQDIDDDAVKELVQALQNNHFITSLILDNNYIAKEGIEELALLTNIKKLSLSGNGLSSEDIFPIIKNKHIEELNLNNNSLNDTFLENLSNNSTLKSLNLSGNTSITENGFKLLLTSQLKELTINNFHISGDKIINALSGNEAPFIKLNLNQNGITDSAIKEFVPGKNLECITLTSNHISFEAAKNFTSSFSAIDCDFSHNPNITEKQLVGLNEIRLKKAEQKKKLDSTPTALSLAFFKEPDSFNKNLKNSDELLKAKSILTKIFSDIYSSNPKLCEIIAENPNIVKEAIEHFIVLKNKKDNIC